MKSLASESIWNGLAVVPAQPDREYRLWVAFRTAFIQDAKLFIYWPNT